MNRHAKPDIEKLAGIKKERLDAKCYYAVYAASHKEDECWWNIVRKMCDEKEISFLLGWKK